MSFREERENNETNFEEKQHCQTSMESLAPTSNAERMLPVDSKSYIAIRAPPSSIVEVLDPLDVEQCYREQG